MYIANPGRLFRLFNWVALLVLPWLGESGAQAQHAHINAGALGKELHSQLSFINGSFFATNSGYVVNMSRASSGVYAGYYQGGITFTALPATSDAGGPAFGHASLGAFLELQIEGVSGPTNASLGFWEEGDTEPRHSLETGKPITPGTVRFALSEGSGLPDSDPFGHIHGRRFTTTQPGLYSLRCRILDTSTSAPGNGPWHRASEPFDLFFQSGITIALIETGANSTRVTFGGWPDVDFYLEAKESLTDESPWVEVAGPEPGLNTLISITHESPAGTQRFYRLRVEGQ